jgi:hypothetical protein
VEASVKQPEEKIEPTRGPTVAAVSLRRVSDETASAVDFRL